MKIDMKRLIRDEKGAAMVLALILLVVGGLIIAPLMGFMSTGLIAGEVYERRMDELYAADAGVEDALWRIQNHVPEVAGLTQCNQYWSYNITDAYGGVAEVNDKRVDVTITLVNNVTFTYRVVSTATGDGSGTKVDAYVIGTSEYDDYSGLLENVITSLNEIDFLGNNIEIIAEGHEPVGNYPEGQWPEAGRLIDFYRQQVEGVRPYDSDEIILTGDVSRGPIYSDIEGLLTIRSSSAGATLTLNDTIYITGDTIVGKTGDYMKLNLNNNTMFIESDTAGSQKAFWLGGNCEVEGPGVIVAIGDIELAPSYSMGSEEGPVFILSVLGSTTLRPGANQGDFYGCIAGNVTVVVQSGSDVYIKYPDEEGWYEGFNFPIGDIQDQQLVYSIYSWEISQL